MDKFQSIRVEWLAADIAVVRIIEKITGKRMTDIAHMDPYLMSPAGIQLQTDIRKILFFIIGEKTVMCSGCLTIFKVNTAQDSRVFCSSYWGINDALFSVFPQTIARYCLWICLWSIWSDKIQPARRCLAMTKRPVVSRSKRLMAR